MREVITDSSKLTTRCDEVNYDLRKGELLQTIRDIKKILYANEDMVCLSAPQIGREDRLFCIKFNDGDIRTFINPIVISERGTHLSRESCVSIPNKEFIVPRSDEIDVAYQTPTGMSEANTFKGYPSEVFQQMINLLDGVLISDFGLEILEGWDEATEEERSQVIELYLKTLDNSSNELKEEIDKDSDMRSMSKAIEFSSKLASGEVTMQELSKDEVNKLVEGIKELKDKD